MNNKQLTILGIVAVIMAILAVTLTQVANRRIARSVQAVPLIQGLDPSKIGSIVLGSGEDEVVLKRNQDVFVVENKDNYPAQVKEISNLITSCLEIQIMERVTNNSQNYEELGVTEDHPVKSVKFFDRKGERITGVLVGKRVSELGGDFVRLVNNDTVYNSSNVPWMRMGALDYIDKKLLEIKQENVARVLVRNNEGRYTIIEDPNGNPVLENIPEGKKVKASDCKDVFTALSYMTFNDVKKDTQELKFDQTYMCQLKDSTLYTIHFAKNDDKYYIKCQAEFTDKTLPTKQEIQQASEEELKDKDAKLQARDAAEEFAQKHQGWVYEISSWQAGKMTKKLEELLEDVEEKPEEKPEASAEEPKADTPEEKDIDQAAQNVEATETTTEPEQAEPAETSEETKPVEQDNSSQESEK